MKVVTVTGGKGGVGKSLIAVNLAAILNKVFNKRVLVVDVDVENPCTYTFLITRQKERFEVYTFSPKILEERCKMCGLCTQYCPTHALVLIPNKGIMHVESLCEGCAICYYICPHKAIIEDKRIIGKISFLKTQYTNLDLIVGELVPGARQHHEVIEHTIELSKRYWNNYDYVILDTPPGTGKGILISLRCADLIIAVTEPTRLGYHDLLKLYKLIFKMQKRSLIVINKYGIPHGTYEEIMNFVKNNNLFYHKIPYDVSILRAYTIGKTLVEFKNVEQQALNSFINLAKKVINFVEK